MGLRAIFQDATAAVLDHLFTEFGVNTCELTTGFIQVFTFIG